VTQEDFVLPALEFPALLCAPALLCVPVLLCIFTWHELDFSPGPPIKTPALLCAAAMLCVFTSR